MSDHQYKFNVTMTCGGCSGAVERVLKRLEGLYTPIPILRPASIPCRSTDWLSLCCLLLLTLKDYRRQNIRCQPRIPDGKHYHRTHCLVRYRAGRDQEDWQDGEYGRG
jgi:hypothetical protein